MSETRQDKLLLMSDRVKRKCDEIARLFDRRHRGEVRVTVVIRTPWLEDGGVLVSNDDFDAAVAEIQRLRVRPEVL